MSTTAADTFSRFVAVLAETLDDPGTDGAALASRLHLSRFHVDRLVSAAAGEPPAALRRRVLLERAAYRLITTDHDVLRVAVEAGYSQQRGVHPRVHPGLRRGRRPGGGPADQLPARRAEPGALQPTGRPPGPRTTEGQLAWTC